MSTIGNETYLNEIANIFMGPFRRFTIKLSLNYEQILFFGGIKFITVKVNTSLIFAIISKLIFP